MMLWKCCTQCISKFGKLSSGHRTGKRQSSFQSPRKAMPNNVQTTTQSHSSHTLAEYCSKLCKWGFNNTWTENVQMLQLVLEKAEEPEIKLPTSTGSQKKQENSRKTSISVSLTMLKPFDCVDHNKLWKILKEMGIPDHLPCLHWSLYAGQEARVRIRHGRMDWFTIGKEVCQGCILSPWLFNLHVEYLMQNAGLKEARARIKIAGKNSITSDMQMTPLLWRKVKKN